MWWWWGWGGAAAGGRESEQAGAKYYAGAWRSENETWAFVRNACDCPGEAAAVAQVLPG